MSTVRTGKLSPSAKERKNHSSAQRRWASPQSAVWQNECMAVSGATSLFLMCMAYAPEELIDRIMKLVEEGAQYGIQASREGQKP